MRRFSIRRIRWLAIVLVVVLHADHVRADAAERGVRIQPDEQNEFVDGQIAGIVLDGKGRPLADRRVELSVRIFSGGLRAIRTAATTMTDSKGRFAFTGLAPGIFEVAVLRGSRIVQTSAPIQLSMGAMNRTVTLSEFRRPMFLRAR